MTQAPVSGLQDLPGAAESGGSNRWVVATMLTAVVAVGISLYAVVGSRPGNAPESGNEARRADVHASRRAPGAGPEAGSEAGSVQAHPPDTTLASGRSRGVPRLWSRRRRGRFFVGAGRGRAAQRIAAGRVTLCCGQACSGRAARYDGSTWRRRHLCHVSGRAPRRRNARPGGTRDDSPGGRRVTGSKSRAGCSRRAGPRVEARASRSGAAAGQEQPQRDRTGSERLTGQWRERGVSAGGGTAAESIARGGQGADRGAPAADPRRLEP